MNTGKDLSVGKFVAWLNLGGGTRLTSGGVSIFLDHGGGRSLILAMLAGIALKLKIFGPGG